MAHKKYDYHKLQAVQREQHSYLVIPNIEQYKDTCNRDTPITYYCVSCKALNTKAFRSCLNGFYCKSCRWMHKNFMEGKFHWTVTSIWSYWYHIIFWYNAKSYFLLDNHSVSERIRYANTYGESDDIPDNTWLKKHHSRFLGALHSRKQNVAMSHLKNSIRPNSSKPRDYYKIYVNMYDYLKNIYDTEGIKGLIPKNLNRKKTFHTHHVRNYPSFDKDKESSDLYQVTGGTPSYFCCDMLGLLEERTIYVHNNCLNNNSKEELMTMFKNNWPSPDTISQIDQEFLQDYTPKLKVPKLPFSLYTVLLKLQQKFKVNINELRKLLGYPRNGYPTHLGFIVKSRAEYIFYQTIDQFNVEIRYEHGKYPPLGKKYTKCKNDFIIRCLDSGIKIWVEIWGNIGEKVKRSSCNYLEKRILKENWGKDQTDYVFLGIEHTDCYKWQNLLEIIATKLPFLKKKDNYIKPTYATRDEEGILLSELQDVANKHNGDLKSTHLNISQKHRVSRYFGTLDGAREKMDNYQGQTTKQLKNAVIQALAMTRQTRVQEEKFPVGRRILSMFQDKVNVRMFNEVAREIGEAERPWINITTLGINGKFGNYIKAITDYYSPELNRIYIVDAGKGKPFYRTKILNVENLYVLSNS